MATYGYIRVSSEMQAQSGLGLEAQISAIGVYAAQKCLQLERIFTDGGVSGATEADARQGLTEALNCLKKDDTLLIAKRDRLGRDMGIVLGIEKTIEKKGARLISCAGEGSESTDKKSSLIQKTLADLMSQCERIDISDRTKRALAEKKSKGQRVGHVPFGMCVASDGIHLEICPQEQEILSEIRQLLVQGLSVRAIARSLNERLIFNRGKPWNHATIQSKKMAA